MSEILKSLLDEDRILSDDELDVLTGISKTTRWRERKAGRFPFLIQLSRGRKGNTLRQIREWRRQRQIAAEARAEASNSDTRGRGRPRKKASEQTT